MKIRSKHDIIADILRLLKEPKLKTRVMYGANLSHSQSQYYFALLMAGKLIQHMDDNRWMTTERGRKFLQLYEEAEMMLMHDEPASPAVQHFSSAIRN